MFMGLPGPNSGLFGAPVFIVSPVGKREGGKKRRRQGVKKRGEKEKKEGRRNKERSEQSKKEF